MADQGRPDSKEEVLCADREQPVAILQVRGHQSACCWEHTSQLVREEEWRVCGWGREGRRVDRWVGEREGGREGRGREEEGRVYCGVTVLLQSVCCGCV